MKTVRVEDLRLRVNNMIAASWEQSPSGTGAEGREALAVLLESILMETGNYQGFSYLDDHGTVSRDEHDESARHYY